MYMYVAISLASWPRAVCLGCVPFDLFPPMGHSEVDLFRRQILLAFPPIIDATLAAQASSPTMADALGVPAMYAFIQQLRPRFLSGSTRMDARGAAE